MRINWIEFENLDTGLKCNRIEFNKDITLLVGLSGAGKTQILEAIITSFNFALHSSNSFHPFSATLNLSIDDKEYEWSYCVKKNINDDLISSKPSIEFVYERLAINGIEQMCRKDGKTDLKYYKDFPEPKNNESLISQYRNDEQYKIILKDFNKLAPLDMDMDIRGVITKDSFIEFKKTVNEITPMYKSFSFFSKFPVIFKLYLAKNFFYDIYIKIFDYVKELFPEIEDIDIVEDEQREAYGVSISVYNHKLLQNDISNGMLKTIYYIVESVTAQENSLILIDEFENGLGVNCIDVLSDLLINERTDLQYIITSHHPRLINSISPIKWKIIERDVDIITNLSSDEKEITNSRHNAYFNLLNRWEFEGKI